MSRSSMISNSTFLEIDKEVGIVLGCHCHLNPKLLTPKLWGIVHKQLHSFKALISSKIKTINPELKKKLLIR